MPRNFRTDEPEDVFVELVEGLADSMVPMLILGVLVCSIGTYVVMETGSVAVLATTVLGLSASLVKIAVILRHRQVQRTRGTPTIRDIRRREGVHAASTFVVGGSVGLLTAAIFALPDVSLHLTATSLLFGYCAGVINRVSIRPRIALGALVCAGVPGTLAAAAGGTGGHLVLAVVFASFLGGAIQSVAYAHETARRGVALRLQMERLARRDPLTGLHNRMGLGEAFDALSRDGRGMVALHAFDLDGFKAVNDRLGHPAGDRLLKSLSDRIRSIVPEAAIASRTGGDEFVVVQVGVESEDAARRLAGRLHDLLTAPYDLGADRLVRVGLSLGYATGHLSDTALDELTHRADAASYVAKRAGGGIRAHGEIAAPPLVPEIAAPRLAASA